MNNNFLSKPMGVTVIGKQEESECDHKGQFMCTKDIKFTGKQHLSVKVASSNSSSKPKEDEAQAKQ